MRTTRVRTIVAVSLLLPILGCGTSRQSSRHLPRPGAGAQTPSSVPTASPPSSWNLEGPVLENLKVQNPSHGSISPLGTDAWALKSDPIDVTADGSYTLRTTVPGNFTLHSALGPVAIAVDFPPNLTFKIAQQGPLTLATDATTNYVELPITVTNLQTPYSHLTIWLY